jgi:hypothetical protein
VKKWIQNVIKVLRIPWSELFKNGSATSVADLYHYDVDPEADPTYHFDVDQDADPDPDFYFMQIWILIII